MFLGKTLYSHGASLHHVYEWVPAKMLEGGWGELEILLVASCYRNRDKLRGDKLRGDKVRPNEPLGSEADFRRCFHTHLFYLMRKNKGL